jgi:arylsulfatase A-like enzyme
MKSLKKHCAILAALLGLLPVTSPAAESSPQPNKKPNIVFILADDAGIGDFSPYGCKYGVTPNIDRLAAEGMKFTRAYSGSAVCAPSRCVLMTGQHTGHALRRANQSKDGLLSLPAAQPTVARLLHDAGYATGGFGKWGLGNPGTTGVPENEGFDVFFGYYDQVHAHDYYTDYLVRNSVNVPYQQSGKHTGKTIPTPASPMRRSSSSRKARIAGSSVMRRGHRRTQTMSFRRTLRIPRRLGQRRRRTTPRWSRLWTRTLAASCRS